MKAYILILLSLVSFAIYAQEKIIVKEVTKTMSKGEKPGIEVRVPQATLEQVVKNWEKTVRNETKNKVEQQGDEYYIYQTVLEKVTATPMNVFAKIWETKEGVFVTAYFEADSNGTFLASTNEVVTQFKAAELYMHDFAVANYKEAVETELEGEEKILKDLEKDLEKLYDEKTSS